MLKIEIELGNEGARTAVKELEDFCEYMNSKMAGEAPDPKGTAALGWVLGDKFKRTLERAIAEQEKKWAEERQAKLPPPPSIRERRRPGARES